MADWLSKLDLERAVAPIAALGLAAGGVLHLLGQSAARDAAWATTCAIVLVPATISGARGLLRGETGVDVIAVLAIAGALALRELLAGAIISIMLTGGTALERYAVAHARSELSALLRRAPRMAHRRTDQGFADIEIGDLAIGDVLVVKPGEVVPTDGLLVSDAAVLDASVITGESRPVNVRMGDPVSSGVTNAGPPLEVRATTTAGESTYAAIVRLVQDAERSRAPVVRLANRYALQFLLLTLAVAGAAWAMTGDAVRALSVLVVATPCPLILAAPAAIISGVSLAARNGIIVKGGAALEALSSAQVLLLDKTGTLTLGRPRVTAVESFGGLSADRLVYLAASVEQLSTHPFAPALLGEARIRGQVLDFPAHAEEQMGAGIAASVAGCRVRLGQLDFVAPGAEISPGLHGVLSRTAIEGSSPVFVAVDGQLAGAMILQDHIRADAPRALRSLRKLGIRRIHMVTGDSTEIAELVGTAVGVDQMHSERTPEEKVAVVQSVRSEGRTIMVGDGVNDAPALALADVGIAMGARGAAAASEAAGVVLTADKLETLVLALRIAKRTRRIAVQSMVAGMGMSLAAMIAAAWGWLGPVPGAVLQEGIDIAVIFYALRALVGRGLLPRRPAGAEQLGRDLQAAHQSLRPQVEEIGSLAHRLEAMTPGEAASQLKRVEAFLARVLIPHERQEQESAYPVIAAMLKEEDPTGPLIHTHREIERLAKLFERRIALLPPGGPGPAELHDLRRALYGLHAVLLLHFDQEEELYVMLGS